MYVSHVAYIWSILFPVYSRIKKVVLYVYIAYIYVLCMCVSSGDRKGISHTGGRWLVDLMCVFPRKSAFGSTEFLVWFGLVRGSVFFPFLGRTAMMIDVDSRRYRCGIR